MKTLKLGIKYGFLAWVAITTYTLLCAAEKSVLGNKYKNNKEEQ